MKKALLIGINYFGQRGQLSGCINDVKNIKGFIMQRYGFKDTPQTMVVLTDDQTHPQFIPTRQNIVQAMQWLVAGARPGDSLFFHFSGHGGQVKDLDGDEVDGTDETICPIDYARNGQITDDEMNAMLVQRLPPGVRLTCVFDSCHSGTALDLPYEYKPDGTLKEKTSTSVAGKSLLDAGMAYARGGVLAAGMKVMKGFQQVARFDQAQEKTKRERSSTADVIMFSGCKDRQTSADTHIRGYGSTGAMSYALIQSLSRNPHPTYNQLLAECRSILASGYSQIPQLSAGRILDMNQVFIM